MCSFKDHQRVVCKEYPYSSSEYLERITKGRSSCRYSFYCKPKKHYKGFRIYCILKELLNFGLWHEHWQDLKTSWPIKEEGRLGILIISSRMPRRNPNPLDQVQFIAQYELLTFQFWSQEDYLRDVLTMEDNHWRLWIFIETEIYDNL